MSQENMAHQASFGLTPPAPREKRFGEELERLEEQNRGLLSILTILFHLFSF
jgi:hypothetical protein